MKRIFSLVLYSAFLFAMEQSAWAQTITRGPYLQSLAPGSIKIKWRTNTATNSRVYYGTAQGNLNLMQDVPASVTDHTVKLTGLQPFTTYYYSVGSTSQVVSGPSAMHRFTTSPIPGTEQPIRLWGIGDFGKANQGQIDVMNSYINYTGNTHTDLWVWFGDNAYNDGTEAEYQTKVFDVFENIMTYIPFYPCPGNHDYNSVCAIPCFQDPADHDGPYLDIVDVPANGEAGGIPSGYELYYSYNYGNAHFISLNSELGSLISSYDWCGTYGAGNFNGSPLHQWLVSDLNNNTLPWTIVYFHQPPYTKGSHDSDDIFELYMKAMRENFLPLFDQYGVDLVLCGHSHVYERSYLLRGHYGNSSTFNNSYKVDGSSGKASLGEEYIKYLDGPTKGHGIVYVVQGNSGSSEPGAAINHPAMYFGEEGTYGSLVLDINGMRVDGRYLRSDGTVQDEFTIIKTNSQIVNNVSASICSGESYFVGGANQTTSGTYYDTINISSGPDTIVVMQLTVTQPISTNRAVSICTGSSYFVGGANQTTAGTYSDVYTNTTGCDSTVITQLSILPALTETSTVTICDGDSYFVGGANQTIAGQYTDMLTASGGCDSTHTTSLVLQQAPEQTVNAAICMGEFYFAGGKNQTEAGTYYDTLATAIGCDSFLTTNLTVNVLPQAPVITQLGNSLSVTPTYVSYQWYKDGAPVSGANFNVAQITGEGDYFVLAGDGNNCKASSDTFTVDFTSVKTPEKMRISILPNPATNNVLISFTKEAVGNLTVEIFNVLGKNVETIAINGFNEAQTWIDLDGIESGVYLFKVQIGNELHVERIVIAKN